MDKRKKFLGQYLIVGMFLSFLLISLIGGFTTQIFKAIKYNNEIVSLKKEIKDIEKDINELKESKKSLADDKYIEYIARNRLKMVKPNEIIYIDINRGSI